jgi:REP element-mobilizing transposase RayT
MQYKENKQYRLRNFDYSGDGEYFVTICIDDRKHHFGEIKNGKMILSEIGQIVDRTWNKIPTNFSNIKLDVYQIMPDHFHGIIIIKQVNQKNLMNQIPTRFKSMEFQSGIKNNPMELKSITLGKVIRWFKGRVKFEANKFNPYFRWQTRFYDRIIRDEKEFYFIGEYIINNPANWGENVLKKYFESLKIITDKINDHVGI